jgi:hypothetical protein
MAAGADKAIVYDPPGAIGLVDSEAVLQLRFDEIDDSERPRDAGGVCEDFDVLIDDTLVLPTVVDAALGRGRSFDGSTTGAAAADLEPGDTLLTRDMSIQVVLSWDAAGQDSASTPGTIIARGLSGSAAQRVSYALQLEVVDAPSHTGKLRWYWQDLAGGDELATGVDVVIPPGQFTMLTATRRWVSSSEVLLRYYVGDQLIGEETSTAGEIGGGTPGAVQLGYRRVAGNPDNILVGVLDELLVVDRELCLEEVEATWLRITKYQPLGEQLFKEMFDPGFPITDDRGSDVQMDIRMTGQAIGYAAAQIENLRANWMPQRAYGHTLEQWEEAVSATPKPAQSIEERRARVLGRFRQRRGVSIPGIGDALQDLIDEATVNDLEFIAFSNTIRDGFATLDPLRWDVTPAASWSAVGGASRSSPAAGSYVLDATTGTGWHYARMSFGGDSKQGQLIAKVAMTTPQAALETGLFFANWASKDFLLAGLRDDAGTFKFVTESYIAGVSQGVVVQHTFAGNPPDLWLWLYQTTTDGMWKAAWSTTDALSGYTHSANITHPTTAHWAGMYVRSTGAIAGAAQVDVDDWLSRATYGHRPLNAYVLLEGFDPDLPGAQSVIEAIRHAYTHGTFITSRSVLCDNPESGCDLGCMGGI